MGDEIKQRLDDVRLYVNKAQEADKAEDFPKSARMWENAIKMLNQLIKIDPNKYNVETYKKKSRRIHRNNGRGKKKKSS